MCFPVKFAKFLRRVLFIEHLWLLLVTPWSFCRIPGNIEIKVNIDAIGEFFGTQCPVRDLSDQNVVNK